MAITAKMYKLGQAARRLNDGSDQLNRLLAEIDKVLGRLMIGMEFTVERPMAERVMKAEDGSRAIELCFLGYLRVRGSYHIALKTVKVLESKRAAASEEPGSIVPVLEAPRQLRHAAVDHLPELVEGLASQVQDVVGKMEERCQVASALLSNLEHMLADESGQGVVPPVATSKSQRSVFSSLRRV